MAEATLNDVSAKLSSQMRVDEVIARGVNGLRDDFQKLYGIQEKLLRQMAEAAREGGSGGGGGGGASPEKEAEKSINPFLAAAIVAATAMVTAVKDYFQNVTKLLKTLFKPVTAAIRFVFRQIRTAFRTLFKASKLGEYAADIGKSIRGLMGRIGSALKVLMPDPEAAQKAFKALKDYFGRIRTFFTSGGDDALKFLTENSIFKVLKNGFIAIKNLLFGSFQGEEIKLVKDFFGRIGQTVGDFFKPIRTFFSAEGPLARVVGMVKNAFSFASEGSGFLKTLRTIGRVVGRLAWPITLIMGVIDSITGAFKGFVNTDGTIAEKLLMGLLGGISGLLEGIVGMPLDLLKGAVAFILDKMGFENAAEFLKGFKFTDIIRDIIMSPIVMLKRAFNGIIELIAAAVERFDIPFVDEKEAAATIRGFKFDDTGESRTEMVARKKGEEQAAGEALDKYDAETKGFGKEKYKSRKQAQIAARKQGLSMTSVAQDDEGNYRVVSKGKGGPQEIKEGQLSGKGATSVDATPVPAAMPGGAPIIVQDNSQKVSGGGTVLAGETRPSTGNGQAMKTGFVAGVGG